MRIADPRRPRQVAAWASLACVVALSTACSSGASSAAPPASDDTTAATASTAAPASTASTAAVAANSPGSPAAPASPPGTPAAAATATAGPTAADTFLAAAQDLNGTLLHEPACGGYGCALSGDSTAFLAGMKWTTWSGTEAVGTGTYRLDDCNPNCAAGHVYAVAATVTLSHPVQACSPSGTRWVWSQASFTFPDGLPAALQGQNAPQNPWTFSALATAAQQSCT